MPPFGRLVSTTARVTATGRVSATGWVSAAGRSATGWAPTEMPKDDDDDEEEEEDDELSGESCGAPSLCGEDKVDEVDEDDEDDEEDEDVEELLMVLFVAQWHQAVGGNIWHRRVWL